MIQIECKKAPIKNNNPKQKRKSPLSIIDVGENQTSYNKFLEFIIEQERIEKEKSKLKEKVKKL